jgi:hypothetical protein
VLQVQGISISEFARREGCSRTLVQRKIASKHLKTLDDGTIDPALVGTGWRQGNRTQVQGATRSAPVAPVAALPGETPAEAAERIVLGGTELLSLADAETLKENYLGRLKQLEYDLKSAAVVPRADISRFVGAEYAAVRTKLLAIPAEQAPRIHRCKTVAEVQDVLMSIVVEALEQLTGDREPATA